MSAVKEQFTERHPLTRLIPDLQNRDPEDTYSVIPYEKVNFTEFKITDVFYQNFEISGQCMLGL